MTEAYPVVRQGLEHPLKEPEGSAMARSFGLFV